MFQGTRKARRQGDSEPEGLLAPKCGFGRQCPVRSKSGSDQGEVSGQECKSQSWPEQPSPLYFGRTVGRGRKGVSSAWTEFRSASTRLLVSDPVHSRCVVPCGCSRAEPNQAQSHSEISSGSRAIGLLCETPKLHIRPVPLPHILHFTDTGCHGVWIWNLKLSSLSSFATDCLGHLGQYTTLLSLAAKSSKCFSSEGSFK